MSTRTRSIAAVGLAVAASLLVTAALNADEEGEKEGPPREVPKTLPAPIVSTHDLMELYNEPLYKYLKAEMDKEQKSDEVYATIHDRGLQAAELFNLVAIRPMKQEHREAWQTHVKTGMKAALELAAAAEKQDEQATGRAYTMLIGNCNDCHRDLAPDHAPTLKP